MFPIFVRDLPAHVSKSKLVEEIETGLKLTKWGRPSGYTTHVIVHFMSEIRLMPLPQLPTLGSVIQATINSVSSLCKHANYIHLVLDSYIEMSLKERECMWRTNMGTRIDIIGMNEDTPTPQRIEKFWASVENKKNLQLLLRNMMNSRSEANPNIIVSSVVCDDEILPAIGPGSKEFPELLSWIIEEADNRLVAHVDDVGAFLQKWIVSHSGMVKRKT